MELVKITDLVGQLGLSSRSLRYYEQVGLIHSVRPEFEKYRFYDSENIERLKQIIVLRKMQIPVKDIIRIYESADMSTVVEVFVERINSIDEQVGALSELKNITNEFLQTMLKNGITKISALPLLYEEMDKQLEIMEERKPVVYNDLSAVSEKLEKPLEISIVALPSMRVLSSYKKANPQESDPDGFNRYLQQNNIVQGNHERFEFQSEHGDVVIQRISDDYDNDSEYSDYIFPGGLFAAANVYLDEDLGERFRSLIKDFDNNKYYQIDYLNDGSLRHAAMLENLISPDDQRELVSLLVPVKKRMADYTLFDKPVEIADISLTEIEAANPVLWAVDVPLGNLTPINNPHYRITENGEAEYISWIMTRGLQATDISVKLPFRVDFEYHPAIDADKGYGHGASENSMCIHHGLHGQDHNYAFGVNINNFSFGHEEALSFHQPVFNDRFYFKGRGRVNNGEYNRITWIIGEKYLACIINGEVRYCGTNFPYMKLNLSMTEAKPIVLSSNGDRKKYIRLIRISQLAYSAKSKIKGELSMITKQSNNIIPVIHRLVTDEHGENYWFNGCAKYVMECLGEPDYDYWFFAGITGDMFTQHYPKSGNWSGDARSSYLLDKGDIAFAETVFEKCGYASSFVTGKELKKNREMYLHTLLGYIDKGIPVIIWQNSNEHGANIVGVFVGYEEHGQTLLYISGNKAEPQRISLEKALRFDGDGENSGWIFVGEKKEQKDLGQLYRDAITSLPKILTAQTDDHYFGAEAFRKWADNIENGYFDGIKPEAFDGWGMYNNFICVLATNGSCCHGFLQKARELNPDMTFLEEISRLYKKMADMWNKDADCLEKLGGGFNVTLEALQNKEKHGKIVAKIREFANVTDEVIKLLSERLAK